MHDILLLPQRLHLFFKYLICVSVQGDGVPVSAGATHVAADAALYVDAASIVAESTPAIASVEPQTTVNTADNEY